MTNRHHHQQNNCSRCKLHTHRVWTKDRDDALKQVPEFYKNRLIKLENDIKDLKSMIERLSADRTKVTSDIERKPLKNIINTSETEAQYTNGVTVTKQPAPLPAEGKTMNNEDQKENHTDGQKNPKKKEEKEEN